MGYIRYLDKETEVFHEFDERGRHRLVVNGQTSRIRSGWTGFASPAFHPSGYVGFTAHFKGEIGAAVTDPTLGFVVAVESLVQLDPEELNAANPWEFENEEGSQ